MSEVYRYACAAVAIARKARFDVIHVHDWMTYPAGILVRKLTGKPLVAHIHALEHDRSGDNMNRDVAGIERAGLEAADRVVAVSHYTKRLVMRQYGIPGDKIEVVHNAVSRSEADRVYAVPERCAHEKRVLFMGRVTFQKGPDYFVEAAKLVLDRIPDVRFVMAGSGDMLPNMVRRVAQLRIGSHFHFTGFLKDEEVDHMYAVSDLYVMPSVSEPFGIAPLEAMAYDVPVLISRQSGVAEVVRNAIKVDFWDIREMANKICAILSYPFLAAEEVRNCREELKAIRWENVADRLNATVRRITDTMYHSADEFLDDLRVVQRSLAACGAVRAAYGPVQTIIWQVESFGFHMVEMEFRQHSVVHARALKDIHENGIHGDLQPMTREVIDTFRAIGSIQKRYGKKMAHRYIISFTKSAQHVADVFELAHLSFAHEEDVPELDVIPLFEQLEDLEGCVDVLDQMLTLPVVQKRLAQTNRRMEVMLGYSDSSKDAGPTTAMLALHSAQERIAKWAEKNDIDLVLMHGRGGAVGRGGGPANKAVLAQPKGSVNCFFKLTEQGEVIFARYGNRTLAQRHVESVAAATLLQSAPSVEKTNTETTQKFWDMAEKLNAASHERYLDLLNTEDFTPWFSTVTPLTEVGLLPIGSRPAKRGLGAKSLDDLRTIPWIFSWSQARINLAAWYGLGTACEQFGDLDQLKAAYQEWPFFRTFIDNIEMSIAKTDQRIAKMYLHLGDRDDLSKKVFTEMQLTRKWVLAIVGDEWPLQRRRVLGCAVRVRNPYVDALSIAQVRALREVRMNQDEMAEEKKAEYMSLILSTVTGVSAGLQNTG